MKRFLIFLIIFILGCIIFYSGWAQAKVPPGSYGVLRSKTHGTAPFVIRDGEFHWVWYKLLPTNTETLVFTPRRMNRPLNVSGALPSGRQYASLAGIDSEFSWGVFGEFSFIIRPESLPSLVRTQNLATETDFKELEEHYTFSIEAFIRQYLTSIGSDQLRIEAVLTSLSSSELVMEVEKAFPDIEDFQCIIRSVQSPDFDLYRAVRSLNDDYMAQMRLVISNDVLRVAETRINQRIRIDELAMYGDLLTKYPMLMEYMKMENEMGNSR